MEEPEEVTESESESVEEPEIDKEKEEMEYLDAILLEQNSFEQPQHNHDMIDPSYVSLGSLLQINTR